MLNLEINNIMKLVNSANDIINFKDNRGYTPLLIAVEKGLLVVVEFLLMHGADITAACNDGRDAFALSADKEITDVLNKYNITQEIDDASHDEVPQSAFGGYGFFDHDNNLPNASVRDDLQAKSSTNSAASYKGLWE